MNWVGGVKKRIVLKEDEQRRQQEFFARHSTAVPRGTYSIGPEKDGRIQRSNPHPGIVPRKRAKDLTYKRIHVGIHGTQDDQEMTSVDSDTRPQTISRQGVRICHNLKLSSCHTAYSEMLIKMQFDGIQKKLKENCKEERRKRKLKVTLNQHLTGSENSVNSKEHDLNINPSCLKTPQHQGPEALRYLKNWLSLNGRHSKKEDLLGGAPPVRHILSLTPDKYKGKRRIWTPIPVKSPPIVSHPKRKVKGRSKAQDRKAEKFTIPENFAKFFVDKILKSPEVARGTYPEYEEMEDERPSCIGATGTEGCTTEGNEEGPEAKTTSAVPSLLSGGGRQIHFSGRSEAAPVLCSGQAKLPPRTVFLAANGTDGSEASVLTGTKGRDSKASSLPVASSGKVKLSDCVRKLYVRESPFVKNHRDKTPYFGNQPVSTWWTPSEHGGTHTDDSENSFKTPSDPSFTDVRNSSVNQSECVDSEPMKSRYVEDVSDAEKRVDSSGSLNDSEMSQRTTSFQLLQSFGNSEEDGTKSDSEPSKTEHLAEEPKERCQPVEEQMPRNEMELFVLTSHELDQFKSTVGSDADRRVIREIMEMSSSSEEEKED